MSQSVLFVLKFSFMHCTCCTNATIYFNRSTSRRCSVKKLFLNISTIHRKNLYRSLFLIKFWNFIEKRLWYRCFQVNFAKFLRTAFFKEQLWWLLLFQLFEILPLHELDRLSCVLQKWKGRSKFSNFFSLEHLEHLYVLLICQYQLKLCL